MAPRDALPPGRSVQRTWVTVTTEHSRDTVQAASRRVLHQSCSHQKDPRACLASLLVRHARLTALPSRTLHAGQCQLNKVPRFSLSSSLEWCIAVFIRSLMDIYREQQNERYCATVWHYLLQYMLCFLGRYLAGTSI